MLIFRLLLSRIIPIVQKIVEITTIPNSTEQPFII